MPVEPIRICAIVCCKLRRRSLSRTHASYDLKLRIPVLRHVHGYSITKICEILVIRKYFVYKTLQIYATLSLDVANPNSCKAGHRCSLNYEDLNYIKFRCHLHSSIFLDELQSDLLSRRDVKVSLSTLFRTLQRLGITCRKIPSHALERNNQHLEHDV
ncbi:hypothetical protein M405DRAFT_622589 [Rhizopogon salebrosus TDB-379]|nr:hypothetical protein M405DRAFT_622589 [Rhizopogon salebrosus TDB-379]